MKPENKTKRRERKARLFDWNARHLTRGWRTKCEESQTGPPPPARRGIKHWRLIFCQRRPAGACLLRHPHTARETRSAFAMSPLDPFPPSASDQGSGGGGSVARIVSRDRLSYNHIFLFFIFVYARVCGLKLAYMFTRQMESSLPRPS